MRRRAFREWLLSPGQPKAVPFFSTIGTLSVVGGMIGTPLWLTIVTVIPVGTIVAYLWDTRRDTREW